MEASGRRARPMPPSVGTPAAVRGSRRRRDSFSSLRNGQAGRPFEGRTVLCSGPGDALGCARPSPFPTCPMGMKKTLPEAGSHEAFPDDFKGAVTDLRQAFTALSASVSDLPARPLQVARFLGLDKNLAWKVARLCQSSDPAEAVRHLPGPAGVKRVLDAFAQGGAGPAEINAVRLAVARFDRMVGRHAGDRATLELLLASGAPERPDAQRMEASRKLAFQGNSATFGVQTRVRFGLQIVAPSAAEPELVDVVAVGGLVDFRRLRASAAWPLISVCSYTDDDEDCCGTRPEP